VKLICRTNFLTSESTKLVTATAAPYLNISRILKINPKPKINPKLFRVMIEFEIDNTPKNIIIFPALLVNGVFQDENELLTTKPLKM
jgi:hypothetical protein